ncbi:S8 family serine peptidase [Neobacillus sp. SCS-31]|uniref:S8 family peptidase n=1 Tax=Neobacillus oceani TaxID=3115292 RepID=UPI0039069EAF
MRKDPIHQANWQHAPRLFRMAFIVGIVSAVLFGSYAQFAAPVRASDFVEKEIVIVYKNEDGKEKVLDTSLEVDYEFKNVPAVAVTMAYKDINELKKDKDIAYIEPNVSFRIAGEEDQYGFQQVTGRAKTRTDGLTGAGVKVAVIDSGISAHGELVIAGGVSTVDYTASYEDDNGHGTHVAGIIAAKSDGKGMVGIAPDVKLYAVKVMGADGNGTLVDVIEGLDWAIANGMDIVNMSLGTPSNSRVLHSLIDTARQKNIIVVAASGNESTSVSYPAKYDNAVAVSAVDSAKQFASFSNFGPEIDFAAPGVGIVSTYPGNRFARMSGTSQAAPHVAGLLAGLKQKYPSQTAGELIETLKLYTEDLGSPGVDSLYGNGLINYGVYVAPAPATKVETPAMPEPTPQPVPAPSEVQEPVPAPVSDPAPAPVPGAEPIPAPAPVVVPAPAPVAEPILAPAPIPAPVSEPGPVATPAPVSEPVPPGSTPAPAPSPTVPVPSLEQPKLVPVPAPSKGEWEKRIADLNTRLASAQKAMDLKINNPQQATKELVAVNKSLSSYKKGTVSQQATVEFIGKYQAIVNEFNKAKKKPSALSVVSVSVKLFTDKGADQNLVKAYIKRTIKTSADAQKVIDEMARKKYNTSLMVKIKAELSAAEKAKKK